MNDDYQQAVCYLDTNLFIYLIDTTGIQKHKKAQILCEHFFKNGNGRISVQVMSEWRNAAIRKFSHWVDAAYRDQFLRQFITWNPLLISSGIILEAEKLCQKYAFSPYDSIHVQCALHMNCRFFLSEDMQDGLIVNDSLTLLNPFKNDSR
ncbi:MAG: PIN domain-containing protein [SAR324 cluster bacterium]|nr:PIN domain-containing protein [SAR324 cluster bacterium]